MPALQVAPERLRGTAMTVGARVAVGGTSVGAAVGGIGAALRSGRAGTGSKQCCDQQDAERNQ